MLIATAGDVLRFCQKCLAACRIGADTAVRMLCPLGISFPGIGSCSHCLGFQRFFMKCRRHLCKQHTDQIVIQIHKEIGSIRIIDPYCFRSLPDLLNRLHRHSLCFLLLFFPDKGMQHNPRQNHPKPDSCQNILPQRSHTHPLRHHSNTVRNGKNIRICNKAITFSQFRS